MTVVETDEDILSSFRSNIDEIRAKRSECYKCESGWTFLLIFHVEMNINNYGPLKGTSFMKLPKIIERKHKYPTPQ